MLRDVVPDIDWGALILTELQRRVWCIQDFSACVVPEQRHFCRR